LARRAVERLPPGGTAVDLCTGAGAIAATLSALRPEAHVVASDIDHRAVACARRNGVEAYAGDLFAPLPPDLAGLVDVVVGVVPYVPTPALPLLQRDTFTFESALSYDGGPGGAIVLELGGDQAGAIGGDLDRLGYVDATVLVDDDGDPRGIEATLSAGRRRGDRRP
jgi:release factor glutamine methyltransferase